jgi:hypothetical protein
LVYFENTTTYLRENESITSQTGLPLQQQLRRSTQQAHEAIRNRKQYGKIGFSGSVQRPAFGLADGRTSTLQWPSAWMNLML